MAVADGGFDDDGHGDLRPVEFRLGHDPRAATAPSQQQVFGLSLATPPAVRGKMLARRVDNEETLRGLSHRRL